MPLDHYVTLGNSGLRVSPFCLGAMTFGEEWGFGADASVSCRILDSFIERGGNFIDAANLYTGGHSEEIIGEHLGADPAKRDGIVIATKFGGNMKPGDPNGGGANRKSIISACEASLRRLKTDYIDLYWQHWEDPFCPVEETMRALDALVQSGKVRYLGFSDTFAWKVARAQTIAELRGWSPLAALQVEYSLVQRTVEGELIPMASSLGMGVTPWGPLRSGVLSGKYSRDNMKAASAGRADSIARADNERVHAILDVLHQLSAELGLTCAQIALAWVRSRPGVTAPIIGARTVEQLEDNLSALDVTLDDATLARLEEVTRPALNFPADFLANAQANSYKGMTVNGRSFGQSSR